MEVLQEIFAQLDHQLPGHSLPANAKVQSEIVLFFNWNIYIEKHSITTQHMMKYKNTTSVEGVMEAKTQFALI